MNLNNGNTLILYERKLRLFRLLHKDLKRLGILLKYKCFHEANKCLEQLEKRIELINKIDKTLEAEKKENFAQIYPIITPLLTEIEKKIRESYIENEKCIDVINEYSRNLRENIEKLVRRTNNA